jgi:hypothetical protein
MMPEEILATEYSPKFDELRKTRMVHAFFKYGPVVTNYEHGLIDSIGSLKARVAMYERTGNTEYLCDVANFAMIEFMQPQHPNAHFDPVDDGQSHIVGMGIQQIKDFDR